LIPVSLRPHWGSLLEKAQGRAFYVHDVDGVVARGKMMRERLPSNYSLYFAMKANHHRVVLSGIQRAGCGVDVVSGGEIEAALGAGFTPQDIVFSGVGKTKEEIGRALQLGIQQMNVESEPEAARIAQLAKEFGVRRVPVVLRVNPDVNPKTHPYISTGLRENKFGVDAHTARELVRLYADSPYLNIRGLSFHIGSQIRDIEPFREATEKVLQLWRDLAQVAGQDFQVLDVGGGLGIDYQVFDIEKDHTDFRHYAETLTDILKSHVPRVFLEPGRFLVARFGFLVAKVEYVKRTDHKNFLILNTGMHHLLRPMLYQAQHRIERATDSQGREDVFDVVGPICESTDVLARNVRLSAEVKEDDWVIIHDVGAYGAVMANNYNLQTPPVQLSIFGGNVL
jgi:diaminopimelate decarboxylase